MGDKNTNDVNDILKKLEGISVASTQDSSSLSFAGQGLKLDKEEDAKVIVDAINAVKVLSSLNLEGNTLGVHASKAIADALSKHKHFKRALWKDMFTGRMKTEIPEALRYLGNGLQTAGARLVELDLSDNAFGPIGVEGLADLLRSSCCYALEELKLNNNGLGITGCKLLSKALHDCYDRSKAEGSPLALKVFIAGRNRLENEGAKMMAEVFKKLKSLERVEMPQNGIYHVGISALSAAFKENPNLVHLNLNDNTITYRGAGPLGEALATLAGLRVLNLGDCLLKSGGAETLANYLADNITLEEVILSCNEISLDGGRAVVKVMHNKPALRQINLSENQFGEAGVEELVEMMKKTGREEFLLVEDDEGECSDEEEVSEEEEEENSDVEGNISADAADFVSPKSESSPCQQSSESATPSTSFETPSSTLNDAQNSVSEFLKEPSISLFNSLGPNCTQAFIDEVNSEPEDKYLDSMLLAIMKVSSLLAPNTSLSSPSPLLETVQGLYHELFSWASASDKLSTVTNALLVHLGLIKCEDKTFKPRYNLAGCMTGVKLAAEAKVLPENTKTLVWTCIALREKKNAGNIPVVDCY